MAVRCILIAFALALAGCGDAGRDAEEVAVPEPAEASPATEVDSPPSAESIIRPSVVEETLGQPSPSPVPEPIAVTVRFPEGGTALDDQARAALDQLVARPQFAELGPITLRGHTDSQGGDQANLATSRRRAEAVADYLAEQGVPRERMRVIALGERRTIAPNAELDGSDSPEGMASNRRVEIDVAAAAEPAEPAAEAGRQ